MRRLKQYIKGIVPFAMLALVVVLCSTVVYAATWEFAFPATVTDNSSTHRTYYPVMIGYGGQQLIDAGYINADGLDTNMQIGTANIRYMISTDNVTAVIPNLPSGGSVTANLYTGYSPNQTNFSIIVGDGGYVSIADNSTLELGDNFSIEMKGYVDTDAGTEKDLVFKPDAFRTYIQVEDAIRASILNASSYPTVAATNGGDSVTGEGSGTSHTVNLPVGIASDDLLLVFFVADENPTVTFPAGWMQLFQKSWSAYVTLGAWYRIADGTESDNITATTSDNQHTAHTTYRITGYYGVPEVVTTVTGEDDEPDPPSLTPWWGSTTTLWLVVAAYDDGQETINDPTNYTNPLNNRSDVAAGAGVGSARRELTATSEDPGTFTISGATEWIANTIAIQPAPTENTTVTVTGITSGERKVIASADETNLALSVTNYSDVHLGNSPQTTALGANVTNSDNSWFINQNNVMPYMEYYKHSVNATLVAHYEPATMLAGAVLVDEQGGDENGAIVWGSNSGVEIVYGEQMGYESAEVPPEAIAEFEMPIAGLPETWFARGENVANLPFYDVFNPIAEEIGMPVQTIYFWWIMGIAFGVALFLIMFTRSALLGVIALTIVLFVGSSMTIIPMWIPFCVLIIDVLIMFLYRQVSY